jgi:hypothetical protein
MLDQAAEWGCAAPYYILVVVPYAPLVDCHYIIP